MLCCCKKNLSGLAESKIKLRLGSLEGEAQVPSSEKGDTILFKNLFNINFVYFAFLSFWICSFGKSLNIASNFFAMCQQNLSFALL